MVGRQGLAHIRTDTHNHGRKVNVSSVFAIGCASVHPQCCREYPCVVEHDDREVSIGGPSQLAKYLGPIWFLLGLCGAQVPHIKPTWVCNGPSGPRCPMLCPLGFLLGYMGDTNRVLTLGFNWVIWAEYA